MSKLEKVATGVSRFSVDGGWIYDFDGNRIVFVPDEPALRRYVVDDIADSLEEIVEALNASPPLQASFNERVGDVSQVWKIGPAGNPELEAIATAALRFKDMFEERHWDEEIECPYIARLFETLNAWTGEEPDEPDNDPLAEVSIG